ncbi:gonadotropin-releasing hormone receptor [Caerostris darwini]|uniref:Gonadotropin-releasing hormone receptor n=1 Tax=Caerostris darwini TaxID=1538125 RepID=A0AAV4VTS9_9ARAC|nr:gonadotropin-releasing hormone receptor [Caerostris darwini]
MRLHKFPANYLNYYILYLLFVVDVIALSDHNLSGSSALKNSEIKIKNFETDVPIGNLKRNLFKLSDKSSLKLVPKFLLRELSMISFCKSEDKTIFKLLEVASTFNCDKFQRHSLNPLEIKTSQKLEKANCKLLDYFKDVTSSLNHNLNFSDNGITIKPLNRPVRNTGPLSVSEHSPSNTSPSNLDVKKEQYVLSKDRNGIENLKSLALFPITLVPKEFPGKEQNVTVEPTPIHDVPTLVANDSLADWNLTERWNDTFCNHSTNHAPTFHTHTLVKGVVLLNLGVLACVGNVATLGSIIRRGRQHSSTVYLLLVHLSVSDLFVTCFCIIGEGFWTLTVEWYGGNFLCKVFKFLQMFSLYLSTFTLVVIGFDRLCAVRFPMRRIKARMQVHKAVIAAWVLSAVLSAPQNFYGQQRNSKMAQVSFRTLFVV